MKKRMTDDQIINRFLQADALLEKYKRVILPAAKELARRKSLHVWRKKGRYRGELGCHDYGLDTVCLHLNGRVHWYVQGKKEHRALDFDVMWRVAVVAAGVKNVHVQGFY
jgi:hypothetical protein